MDERSDVLGERERPARGRRIAVEVSVADEHDGGGRYSERR
jgi:hypothetical protein